jgi:TolA-binding protein
MKRKLSIVLSLVAGIAVVSWAADFSGGKPQADQKPQTDQNAVQELRAQITELRAKVQSLENQTRTLQTTVEQLKQSQTRVPTPLSWLQSPAPNASLPLASSSRPPTIWGQGEVNGWTYYVVPCEQQSR